MIRPLALAACLGFSSTLWAQAPARPPRVWAVVIGIDACDDPAIAPTRGATVEARAIRRWLIEAAGWPSSQVLAMDPSSPNGHGPVAEQIAELRPTRANLDWAVREWLPDRVRPGDVVLVAFCGQAIGGWADQPSARDVLLPVDAKANRLNETGWPLPDALDTLAARGENPILVWLDTSLSGRGTPAAKLDGRRTSASRMLAELARWPGVSAWIAADGHPVVVPEARGARGAFIPAVLAAMGTRDRPSNLLGALSTLNRDPILAPQGFRASGGLGPACSLWPKMLADAAPPPSELMLQRGHSDRVTAIAFSADGATMVSASMDSTIKVWRTSDRTLLRTLPAHMIGVSALALSPDATFLASGDGAGRVLLWSLLDLKARRPVGASPHARGIAKLDWLKDGSGFAALDLGGKAVLWTSDGRAIAPVTLSTSATALAAGFDAIAIASEAVGTPASLRIVSAKGAPIRTIDGSGAGIVADALAVDGSRIAAGDRDGHSASGISRPGRPSGRSRWGRSRPSPSRARPPMRRPGT